jgi:DNA-binding LacI/PurR family transcriptional regulator
VNLKTYTENVESANKLAQRAGVSPSVVYRALDGADIKMSTALKIVEASGYKINLSALALERGKSPSPTTDAHGSGNP